MEMEKKKKDRAEDEVEREREKKSFGAADRFQSPWGNFALLSN